MTYIIIGTACYQDAAFFEFRLDIEVPSFMMGDCPQANKCTCNKNDDRRYGT